ncbi:hypothetical protein CBG24_05930 [Limosilactobacillus reuteri]|uniref:Uncharacterized protein n=2 Tax=Limosilactobacillus reuteri TaxID=1598 RepID=A0AB73Q497_LIMRT|nr:hypothetical protein CBG19_01075 [Limosilactobacillus reuteri]OYS93713.1 hypothetical protein CBG10_07995 [Limosilactobacillus reuteri]OYS94508.1 hypothetical protein CBG15_03910 [Limosilactobacillus reuteri]OYS97511.1 hypothetical protein CBG13_04000 [Limosilactobacillus reuteri]OYS99841.1 hypothetical protein CBG24_05930 [Limosilactobacillus reuteri]
MSTRYDKVIKFEGKYLKVNTLAPIILAKQLKKGTILTDEIINKDFGPANFITVENKDVVDAIDNKTNVQVQLGTLNNF